MSGRHVDHTFRDNPMRRRGGKVGYSPVDDGYDHSEVKFGKTMNTRDPWKGARDLGRMVVLMAILIACFSVVGYVGYLLGRDQGPNKGLGPDRKGSGHAMYQLQKLRGAYGHTPHVWNEEKQEWIPVRGPKMAEEDNDEDVEE